MGLCISKSFSNNSKSSNDSLEGGFVDPTHPTLIPTHTHPSIKSSTHLIHDKTHRSTSSDFIYHNKNEKLIMSTYNPSTSIHHQQEHLIINNNNKSMDIDEDLEAPQLSTCINSFNINQPLKALGSASNVNSIHSRKSSMCCSTASPTSESSSLEYIQNIKNTNTQHNINTCMHASTTFPFSNFTSPSPITQISSETLKNLSCSFRFIGSRPPIYESDSSPSSIASSPSGGYEITVCDDIKPFSKNRSLSLPHIDSTFISSRLTRSLDDFSPTRFSLDFSSSVSILVIPSRSTSPRYRQKWIESIEKNKLLIITDRQFPTGGCIRSVPKLDHFSMGILGRRRANSLQTM